MVLGDRHRASTDRPIPVSATGRAWLTIEELVTWRCAFAVLALGPLVGVAAMARLKTVPEAASIAGGLG